MNNKKSIWFISAKAMLMSFFSSIISFMLNCLIVVIATDKFFAGDAVGTRIIMQVVGLFCQLIFFYGLLWDTGHNDAQLNRLGQAKYPIWRGLIIGLIAAIPYYIMSVLMMLMTFDLIPDITGLLRALSSQFWGLYTFLLPVATGGAAEIGKIEIATSTAQPWQAILAVFVPTLMVPIAQLPYYLGRIGFELESKIFFKSNKKKK
ncbi:MAG: hypothetical protein IJO86_02640 [Oscillospiraceae bacterium]|nr:hypothetical protein [Oscillospiraceae bacterium]